MRFLFSLLICLFPYTAMAELSEAEKAAKSQRGISPAERELRAVGCAFSIVDTGQNIDLSPSLTVPVVSLPDLSVLTTMEIVVSKEKGKFDINSFADLPNGGIGGKDFCKIVEVDGYPRPQKAGDQIISAGLLLRGNMDLLTFYPNTGEEILRRNQLRKVLAGKFAAVDLNQTDLDAWYRQQGGAWPKRKLGRFGIRIDKIHYIPIE